MKQKNQVKDVKEAQIKKETSVDDIEMAKRY